MAYKIFATDMDDTLLDENLQISEENMAALSYAHSKGVKIVLATGRATNSLMPYAKSFPFYSQDDFFISYNGAIAGKTDGSILLKNTHKNPVYSALIDIGRLYGVDIQTYLEDEFIVERYTQLTEKYEHTCGIKAVQLSDLKDKKESLKILYNCHDVPLLEKLKKNIEEEFKDQVNVFFSKPTFLEVLPGNASKGTALAEIARQLLVNPQEIIAIGDSQNDLSMVQLAGMGVCVQNGRESVKRAATYITQQDHNHHAVAEVIYKFI